MPEQKNNFKSHVMIKLFFSVLLLGAVFYSSAQQSTFPELKKSFNESGSHYIKATVLGQFWMRHSELNPGSTVSDFPTKQVTDFGIRRLRFNLMAQLSDRMFFYVQFGQNNYSYLSKMYTGAFFHDAVGEYKIHPKKLTVGTGLTGWSGLSRFSAPSAGSILGVDVPLYQQVTNGVNDQFLRKLSMYAKGKLGKLDYRLILSKPLIAANSSVPLGTLNADYATFSLKPTKLQSQGYINYQFFDQEDNTLGYFNGSYLGKKKVLTVGAGWIHQPDAMWMLNSQLDTVDSDLLLIGVDVFGEFPLSSRKNTLTFYAAFTEYQMGHNYLRAVGVMNPATGISGASAINGPGNGFVMIGTGQTYFTQVGYKFRDNLFKSSGTFQVFGATQLSNYKRLDQSMTLVEGGVNWLVNGSHQQKVSFSLQSRPIFELENGSYTEKSRKGMAVLQYQIFI